MALSLRQMEAQKSSQRRRGVTDKSQYHRELSDTRQASVVNDRPKHGYSEMRELSRAFVELQPPHCAMFLEIIRYARFSNPQVFGQLFLEAGSFLGRTPAPNEIAYGNPQRLARFDVVVGHLVRVREQQDAGTGRGGICLSKLRLRAREQAPKLRL